MVLGYLHARIGDCCRLTAAIAERTAESISETFEFSPARDNKTRQSDRDYVLANSHEDILDVQIVHDASPDFVANECSDHAAYPTK